jgi:hypothetical protein
LISRDEVMPTIEARLRRELRKYAIELRKLAYSLPHGVGEHALLQLSERMGAVADQDLGATSASLANEDPLALGTGIEQAVLAEPDEARTDRTGW